jgi:prostaglandin-endoperoxide synthase 2
VIAVGGSAHNRVEEAADLFDRGETVTCDKSTVLFASFAQWFTDGFLRSDNSERRDPRRTTSNHEIDLCQLYGLRPEVTKLLRRRDRGLLKSQMINGEEYPPFLCENGVVKPEVHGLEVVRFDRLSVEQRNGLFAMGGDRANLQTGYAMLNVLFLREHNRVARLLGRSTRTGTTSGCSRPRATFSSSC